MEDSTAIHNHTITIEENVSVSEIDISWIAAVGDLLMSISFIVLFLQVIVLRMQFRMIRAKPDRFQYALIFVQLFVASSGIAHLISCIIIWFDEAQIFFVLGKGLSSFICLTATFFIIQYVPEISKFQRRNMILENELGNAIRHEKTLRAENDFLVKLREITQAIRMDLDLNRICQKAVSQLTMVNTASDGAALFLLDDTLIHDENEATYGGVGGGGGNNFSNPANNHRRSGTGSDFNFLNFSRRKKGMPPSIASTKSSCSSVIISMDPIASSSNCLSRMGTPQQQNQNHLHHHHTQPHHHHHHQQQQQQKAHVLEDSSLLADQRNDTRPTYPVAAASLFNDDLGLLEESCNNSEMDKIPDASSFRYNYTCNALSTKISTWDYSSNESNSQHRQQYLSKFKLALTPATLESLLNGRDRRALKIVAKKDFNTIFEAEDEYLELLKEFDYVYLAAMHGNHAQGVLVLFQKSEPGSVYEGDIEGDFIHDVINQIEIAWDQAYQIQQENRRIKELHLQWQRNQALSQAKQEAELSSRLKTEYLATMSHEIRTPMNAIVGFVDLLLFESEEENSLTQEQRQTLKIIQNSSQCLLTLLNDILDYTKIDNGYLQLETVEFQVSRTVEQVMELISAQKKNPSTTTLLHLNSFIDPKLPKVCIGDRNRLRQILVNLLSNSIKFTEKGDVFLCCSLTPDLPIKVPFLSDPECSTYNSRMRGEAQKSTKLLSSGGGGVVEEPTMLARADPDKSPETVVLYFHVVDTGIGMKNDRLQLLFRKFCQLDSSITRRYGGTGLGLAICAKLVEFQNGTIQVQSCFGKGSVFSFSIPMEIANNGDCVTGSCGAATTSSFTTIKSSSPKHFLNLVPYLPVSPMLQSETLILVYENWKTTSQAIDYLFKGMQIKSKYRIISKKEALLDYLFKSLKRLDGESLKEISGLEYRKSVFLVSETLFEEAQDQQDQQDHGLIIQIFDRLKELQIPTVLLVSTNLRPKKSFEVKSPVTGKVIEIHLDHMLQNPLQQDVFVSMMEKIWSKREDVVKMDDDEKVEKSEEKIDEKSDEKLEEKPTIQIATTASKVPKSPLLTNAGAIKDGTFSHLSVLVVDDNAINRMVITKLLKMINIHQVKCAVNGLEAVKMVYSNRFNIVFMDVSMPEMDGLTATKILKDDLDRALKVTDDNSNEHEHEQEHEVIKDKVMKHDSEEERQRKQQQQQQHRQITENVKEIHRELSTLRSELESRGTFVDPSKTWIIAMTASAMLEEQRMCYEAGMDDFMAKPLTLDQVKKSIHHYSEKSK